VAVEEPVASEPELESTPEPEAVVVEEKVAEPEEEPEQKPKVGEGTTGSIFDMLAEKFNSFLSLFDPMLKEDVEGAKGFIKEYL